MRIHQRLRLQGGLITMEQAVEGGLTDRQVLGRVQRGEWLRLRRGVYLVASAPLTWEVRQRAATLGRSCVVSHRAATVLHGLGVFTEPRPEITVASGTRRKGDVIIHWSRQWHLRDEISRRGMACTGLDRTILDCAAVCSIETVERLAESAIRQRRTTWSDLELCRATHATSGRTGVGPMRKLLDRRRGSPDVSRSDFSLLVANLLIEAGLPAPVLEHQVIDPDGGHILFLDLAWPDLRRAVELDGLAWHFTPAELERDKWKRNQVKAQGWAIQEITWSMYQDHADEVVSLVGRFLGS